MGDVAGTKLVIMRAIAGYVSDIERYVSAIACIIGGLLQTFCPFCCASIGKLLTFVAVYQYPSYYD